MVSTHGCACEVRRFVCGRSMAGAVEQAECARREQNAYEGQAAIWSVGLNTWPSISVGPVTALAA